MRIAVLGTGRVGSTIGAKLVRVGQQVVMGSRSRDNARAAGEGNLRGKVLVDVANPLDFSKGMPPTLTICNTDSLGEQIQRTFPAAKVVKALNTMNCFVMVNPALVPGDHNVFLCGDDADAKTLVTELLVDAFGWKRDNVLDLGGISAARGTEMLLPLWLRLWGALQNPNINFHIAVGMTPQAARPEASTASATG